MTSPRASDADRAAIEALVQRILDLKAADPSTDSGQALAQYEAEIDAIVEFLYFHRGDRGTRTNVAGESVPEPDTYD